MFASTYHIMKAIMNSGDSKHDFVVRHIDEEPSKSKCIFVQDVSCNTSAPVKFKVNIRAVPNKESIISDASRYLLRLNNTVWRLDVTDPYTEDVIDYEIDVQVSNFVDDGIDDVKNLSKTCTVTFVIYEKKRTPRKEEPNAE